MTESAGAHLAAALRAEGAPTSAAVRLEADERGTRLAFDQIREGDHGFQYHDRIVLVVTTDAYRRLAAKVLSCENTEDGARLALHDRRAAIG